MQSLEPVQNLPRVFICYSYQDKQYKDRLITYLDIPPEQLTIWQDLRHFDNGQLQPESAIDDAINSADVAVLLISNAFLNSDFSRYEALRHQLQDSANQGLKILPFIVSPCPWQHVNWLSSLKARPKHGKDLASLNKIEAKQALIDFTAEISEALNFEPPGKLVTKASKSKALSTNNARVQTLTLISLFESPVEKTVINQLRKPPVITGVNDVLCQQSYKQWSDTLNGLAQRELMIVANAHGTATFDCTDEIKKEYSQRLQQQNPDGFKAVHIRLYNYYKELPSKELPDTIDEMEPLFNAITHGCLAGLYNTVYYDIYFSRISHREIYRTQKQPKRFARFLSVLSNFFLDPWRHLHPDLNNHTQSVIFSLTGFMLMSQGRLIEAIDPLEAGAKLDTQNENWSDASTSAGNLSRLYLFIGRVAEAEQTAKQVINFAKNSGDDYLLARQLAIYADTLHHAGQSQEAQNAFNESEEVIKNSNVANLAFHFSYLFSTLLVELGQYDIAINRANKSYNSAKRKGNTLWMAHNRLVKGKALMAQVITLLQPNLAQAKTCLNQAVEGFRKAGGQEYLPRGLLARAALFKYEKSYAKAWQDLDETHQIALATQMKLHQADYHLESCRIITTQLQEHSQPGAEHEISHDGELFILSTTAMENRFKKHLQQATTLIEQTGYHLRDSELEALRPIRTPPVNNPITDEQIITLAFNMVVARWAAPELLVKFDHQSFITALEKNLEPGEAYKMLLAAEKQLGESQQTVEPNPLWFAWIRNTQGKVINQFIENHCP